jgi:hypothetical protein
MLAEQYIFQGFGWTGGVMMLTVPANAGAEGEFLPFCQEVSA